MASTPGTPRRRSQAAPGCSSEVISRATNSATNSTSRRAITAMSAAASRRMTRIRHDQPATVRSPAGTASTASFRGIGR